MPLFDGDVIYIPTITTHSPLSILFRH